MSEDNNKIQCLLAEYGTIREEIKAFLEIIHRWMFALLPFAGAVYALAAKEKNGLLSLFGVGITVMVLFYVRSRLARIIYNAAPISTSSLKVKSRGSIGKLFTT